MCSTAHARLPPGKEQPIPQDAEHPGALPLPLAPSLATYLQRLRELGAVEGTQGAVELNPTLKPVLEALHHVLSGGEVEVRVLRGGQHDILRELERHMAQSLREANTCTEDDLLEVDVAV